MGYVVRNVLWLQRLSALYIVVAFLLGAEPLALVLMTGLTGLLYASFAYRVAPLLEAKSDPLGGITMGTLNEQIINTAGFFTVAVLLSLLGLDSTTIGISTAVLWHLQIILMVDLTDTRKRKAISNE